MTTAADQAFERAAAKLREASEKAAERGGIAAKLVAPLNDDAHFLRQIKPSLVVERMRGGTPTVGRKPAPAAPSGPQLERRGAGGAGGELNPLGVVGVAFALGILVAKVIDWRGHAYPRR